jgi:hypothetical protein
MLYVQSRPFVKYHENLTHLQHRLRTPDKTSVAALCREWSSCTEFNCQPEVGQNDETTNVVEER